MTLDLDRIDPTAPLPAGKPTTRGTTAKPNAWTTAEKIKVKGRYDAADLAPVQHLDFGAGAPPYVRGPYATMYTQRPWTI
ncbi:MAG: methylmalonyl-CoA mutase family protein, partial [Catalinimonas sp.]